jgi:succinyl-CoA synthetase beta subunit
MMPVAPDVRSKKSAAASIYHSLTHSVIKTVSLTQSINQTINHSHSLTHHSPSATQYSHLCKVNPIAETPDGRVLVATPRYDDNAEFRQGSIFKLRDRTQEDSREVEAAKYDLNYIGLTGNIGCAIMGVIKVSCFLQNQYASKPYFSAQG